LRVRNAPRPSTTAKLATGLRLQSWLNRVVMSSLLYEPCYLQCFICASLLHRLEAFCRHADGDLLAEFGNEKGFRLEIDLAAAFARRVEFGSTDAVGIPASYLRLFTRYFACSRHIYFLTACYACPVVKPKVCTMGSHTRAISRRIVHGQAA